MTHTASDSVTIPTVLELCEKFDTAKSLAIAICLRYDHEALFQIGIDPLHYVTAESFAVDYAVVNLLKKFKGLTVGFDTARLATEAWMSSESRCSQTNKRFRPGASPLIGTLGTVLYRASLKIASVLGDLDVAECLDRCEWGNGATYDVSRRDAIDAKYSNQVTVTAGCLKWGQLVLSGDPHWFWALTGLRPEGAFSPLANCFSVVRGNRFATVPKTSKIDRCIAIEPTMNGFIQSGVGRVIRSRLKRHGIDLTDQGLNQRLAARAAAEGLATLDLSAASDTISRELVMSLLPLDWALFLDSIRSKSTLVEDKWIYLSKFSSMGNGFTFELETLIFLCICHAALDVAEVSGRVAVFGDDIIVPAAGASATVAALEACGFEINRDKSFTSGVFYESCGYHYFDGVLVTPPYQKNLVNSSAELIRFANRLVRWSIRVRGAWGRDPAIASVRRSLVRHFAKVYGSNGPIPAVPLGTPGDGGFLYPHAHFDHCDRSHGILCHVLLWKEDVRALRDLPIYACKLRFPSKQFESRRMRRRGEGPWQTRNVFPTRNGRYVLATQWINVHDIDWQMASPEAPPMYFGGVPRERPDSRR